MKTVAIIPAYNEESRVADAVRDASCFVDHVVVVDDCSYDQTFDEAYSSGAYALRHVLNRGQGAALQTGTSFALKNLNPDVIVHFDADGQMQGRDIPKMIDLLSNSDVDVVLGSRFLHGCPDMPLSRKITLKLAIIFTLVVSGIKLSDAHCGFRILSKSAAKRICITRDRMAHASEILDLIKVNRLKYTECPVDIKYSDETLAKGQSSLGAITIVKDLIKSKFFDV
ncbi:glycosyltransferase family 2 protein [Candidatus Uhrbacteria bacterium]|jgi:polyprenyl-phospho-N-acetylgalactosaminyl synthase|nr:glycosyltransferase family 2 protein [Candidatus Uhrbacteria bacterium]MBT7717573.1 glycosyltransferase family 2 protein [Candidatus Uhrbacteria bacterium]